MWYGLWKRCSCECFSSRACWRLWRLEPCVRCGNVRVSQCLPYAGLGFDSCSISLGLNHPRPGRSWRRPVREHQTMAHPKRMLEQASPRPNPIERVVRKDGTQPGFFIEVAHTIDSRARVDHPRPPCGPGPRGGQQFRRQKKQAW